MSTMKTKPSKRSSIPIEHEFVEFIPDNLLENRLYISIPYASAAHSCFCGCGTRVVTPISPTGWELLFDGDTVSLRPSIGNWSFPCRSHYWIVRNRVIWARPMTAEEIEKGRRRDRKLTESYFSETLTSTDQSTREWMGVGESVDDSTTDAGDSTTHGDPHSDSD
jgi:hypothetical protein